MLGRECELLDSESNVIAGVRTKSLSWSGEDVDLTSGEDNGKTLLDELSGQETVTLSVEGISKDPHFRAIALGDGPKMLTGYTLRWKLMNEGNTTPESITGNMKISAYENGLPYNDAITFSASLTISGEWTYTPEAA